MNDSAETDIAEIDSEQTTREPALDWRNLWYPVSFLEDLPRDRPSAITLYDEPLVLFFDGEGRLSCLQDKCAHRAARLSDGQIVDGRLECLYHGWQYGADGKCLRIPQLADRLAIPEKACIRRFPLEIKQGLVWIWAGDPEMADPSSIATTQALDDPSVTKLDFQMDLPYDQSYFIENVIDVAHIHIAHHGVRGGGDRAAAKPIRFEILESSISGIRAELGSMDDGGQTQNSVLKRALVDFIAPNLIRYTTEYRNESLISGLDLYSLPLGKSRCRMFYRKYANFTSWKESWKPRWLEHWTQCLILQQDMNVVIGQYEAIERAKGGLGKLWLPLKTSDKLVIEYRKWLDKYGENLPFYRGFSTSKQSKEDPFVARASSDRYSLHTKICGTCDKTYRRINNSIRALWIAVTILAALGIVTAGSAVSTTSVVLVLGSMIGIAALNRMKIQFE